MLELNYPIIALGLFSVAALFSLLKHPEIHFRSRPVSRLHSWGWLLLIWIAALSIRMYRLDEFHKIDELSARYSLVALDVLSGNLHFPFIPRYEFDESLVGFLIVPWFSSIGCSWVSTKLFSVLVSSLMIPIVFFAIRRSAGLEAAVASSGLIAMSEYFQKTDPLLGFLRFTLLAMIMIEIISTIDSIVRMKHYLVKIAWLMLLCVVSIYIHSFGRLIPFFASLIIGIRWLHIHASIKRRLIMALIAIWSVSLPTMAHIFREISLNPGYVFFKGRQIIGQHEHYPLSWSLVWMSARSVLENFNYRASLHQMFSDQWPLFRPATGILFLAGLLSMFSNLRALYSRQFLSAFFFALLPLCAITPGNWRGIYFAPAVAFATMIAGTYLAAFAANLFRFRRGLPCLAIATVLLIVGMVRIPGFYEGPFAPNSALDQNTLLLLDLERAPDIPHFFSMNLDQCLPDLAIFEFTRSVNLSEYYVFMNEPLRFMDGYQSESAITKGVLGDRTAVLILASSEHKSIREIHHLFPEARHAKLPHSGLLAITICGTDD